MIHFDPRPASAARPLSRPLSRPLRARLRGASALVAAAALPGAAFAGPEGGVVVGGAATIAQNGTTTTITQTTGRAVINWESFDIGANEATRFAQPDTGSITVNRVQSDLPTNIAGELTANGNVWIINRNGVTFHEGARVDVHGLVATTADIDTAKFMAGSNSFDIEGNPDAAVINRGSITFGEAGLAALVGAHAANEGVIAGKLGTAVVAGRRTFAVDVSGGDGILALETPDLAGSVSASNSGTIDVEGGWVVVSAEETAEALESLVQAGGTIDAGDGGAVRIEGGAVTASGAISAAGGAVDIRGEEIALAADASVDVASAAGGGTIAVGGGLRGEGRQARKVTVEEGASLSAAGLGAADGGTVTVWSQDATLFQGFIDISGGGNGGFAEVSGGWLGYAGEVDAAALAGAAGVLLLDPDVINIVSGAGAIIGGSVDNQGGGTSDIDVASINAFNGTLILEANDTINVNAAIAESGGNTLTLELRAGEDINVNASIAILGGLRLSADHSFAAESVVGSGSNPAADNQGSINFANGADITTGGALLMTIGNGDDTAITFAAAGGDSYDLVAGTGGLVLSRIVMAEDVSISAAGGAITQNTGALINNSPLPDISTIDTGGATLSLTAASVTLDNAGNQIGSLALNVSAASSVTTDVALELQSSTLPTLVSGDGLSLTLGGTDQNLTQAAASVISGVLDFDVSGAVALTETTNTFEQITGSADAISVGNSTGLAFGGTADADTGTAGFDAVAITLASGNLTQAAAIEAGTLTLTLAGDGALTMAGNSVDTLAGGAAGALSLVNDGDLDLNLTGAQPTTLSVTLNAGGGEDGNLTQSAAVDSAALVVDVAGTATLDDAGNSFAALSATTGAGGASSFTTDGALALGDSSFGAATTLHVAGNLTQTAMTAASGAIILDVGGDATLDSATNAITALTGIADNVTLTNTAGVAIGVTADDDRVTAGFDGTITVTASAGNITSSGAVEAASVDVTATAGSITLTDAGNAFTSATASAGAGPSAITAAGALDLGASDFAGGVTITTGGDLTQSGAITVTGGALTLAVDGDALLFGFANAVTAVAGSADSLQLVVAGALDLAFTADSDLAGAADGSVDIDITGPLTQSGALRAASLGVFGSATDVTLTDAGNEIARIEGAATGAVAVVSTGDLVLDFDAGGPSLAVTLNAGGGEDGDLTQIFAINAAAVTLDVDGTATLDNAANAYASLSATTGAGASSFETTAAALDLGASSFGGSASIALTTAGADLTQSGAVSGALAVTGTGAVTLTNAANDISSLTGSADSVTVATTGDIAFAFTADADPMTAGFDGAASVTTTGGSITSAGAVEAASLTVSATGSVALADAGNDFGSLTAATGAGPSAIASVRAVELQSSSFTGGVTLTIGGTDQNLTQAAASTVSGAIDLDVSGAAALTEAGNAITAVSGIADGITVRTTTSIAVSGTADDDRGTAAGDGTYVVFSGGNVTSGGAVVANAFGADATGTVNVADAGNSFGVVAVIAGAGSSSVASDRSLVLDDTIDVAGDLSVTVGGTDQSLTQGVILNVSGTLDIDVSGDATLDNFSNTVTALTGAADNVTFDAAGALAVGLTADSDRAGDPDGTLDLTTGGALTSSGATRAQDLILNVAAGGASITGAGNEIDAVSGSVTGALTMVNDGDLAYGIAGTSPSSLDITLNAAGGEAGNLTQTVSIEASSVTVDVDGGATLTNAANSFSSLTATTGAASGFTTDVALDLGASSFTGATAITVGGIDQNLTQSGAATVTGGTLTLDVSGQALLASATNNLVSVDVTADRFEIIDADALEIAGATLSGDADITTGGNLTQSGAMDVASLAIDVTGVVVLDDVANDLNQVTGTATAGITLVDGGAITLGTSSTLLFVTAGGAIDDGAGGIDTSGAAGLFAYQDNGGVGLDSFFDVTLNNASTDIGGALSLTGATLAVQQVAGLSVIDAYATTAASFETMGALSLSRVAVGTGGAGATVSIDAPGDLLAAGASVTASDVQAAEITIGGAGSSFGTAAAATGAISLTRFVADALVIGDGASITLANGAAPIAFGNFTGDVTLSEIDLTGAMASTIITTGTLTLDGVRSNSLTLSATDLTLGFLAVNGDLDATATAGSILSATNAQLDVPDGATVAAPVYLGAGEGPAVADATVAAFSPTNLIAVSGTTTLAAADAVFLVSADPDETGAADDFFNDFVGDVTITDVTAGDALLIAIEDANDLGLGGVTATAAGSNAVFVAGAAGGSGAIGQTGALAINGTAGFVAAAGSDIDLSDPLNAFADVAVLGDDATVVAATIGTLFVDITGALTAQSDLGIAVTGTAGGAAQIDGFGDNVTVQAFEAASLTVSSGNDLVVDGVSVAGNGDLSAQGTMIIADAIFGGGLLASSDADMLADSVVVGGTASLAGAQSLLGDLTVNNLVAGAATLTATGNVVIGPAAIAGDLNVQALSGDIRAADGDDDGTVLGRAVSFGGTAISSGGSLGGFGGVTIHDVDGNGSGDAIGFAGFDWTAGADAGVGATVGLSVGGNTLLVAASTASSSLFADGSVDFTAPTTQAITMTPGSDGLSFDYQGLVALRATGTAALQDDAGGITFGVPAAGWTTAGGDAAILETGTTVFDAAAVDVGALAVTTTGAGGDLRDSPDDVDGAQGDELDAILVANGVDFDLSGDLLFDGIDGTTATGADGTTTHSLFGILNISAQSIRLSTLSSQQLGNVDATDAVFRSASNITDAAGGTIEITGAGASFIALDDRGTLDAGDDVYADVILDNAAHRLNGTTSAVGATVEIRTGVGRVGANADLLAEDVYAATALILSAAGDLTVNRAWSGSRTAVLADGSFGVNADGDMILRAGAAGDVTAADIRAGALTVEQADATDGSAAAGGVAGIDVSAFEIGTGDVTAEATGLASFVDGAIGGALDIDAGTTVATGIIGGAASSVAIATTGDATATGIVAGRLSVTGANVLLGFLALSESDLTDGVAALTATATDPSGTVRTMTDADLAPAIPTASSIAIAAPALPSRFPASDAAPVAAIADASVSATPGGFLIEAADAVLTGPGGVFVTSTTAGGGRVNEIGTISVFAAGADVAIEDGSALVLDVIEADDLVVSTGGDITQTATGGVTATGLADFIAGGGADVVLTNASNQFGSGTSGVRVIAANAFFNDADGFDVLAGALTGLLEIAGQSGDVTVSDVTASDVSVDASGAVGAQRIAAGSSIGLGAGGAVAASDLSGAGASVTLSSTGAGVTLTDFVLGAVTIDGAAGGATISDGTVSGAVSIDTPTVTDVALDNLSAGSIDIDVAGGVTMTSVRASGAVAALARGGDIGFGRVATGGGLTLQTLDGDIASIDAPGSDGAAASAAGPLAASLGFDTETRMGDTDAGRVEASIAAGTDASGTDPATLDQLSVGGDLVLLAGAGMGGNGDVTVRTPTDGAASGVTGAVMIAADGNAEIQLDGDILIDAVAATDLTGASLSALGADVGGSLFVRSGAGDVSSMTVATGGISQGAAIEVAGAAEFVTGRHAGGALAAAELQDIALSNADNRFGGAVALLGADVTLAAQGDLTVTNALALDNGGGTGTLTLTAVEDLSNTGSGEIFLSRAAADVAVIATGRRLTASDVASGGSVALTAAEGDLSAMRVSAATTLTAEASGAASLDRVEAGGDMQLRAAGGDLLLAGIRADGLSAEADAGAIRTRATTAGDALLDASFSGLDADNATTAAGTRVLDDLSAPANLLDVTSGAGFRAGGDIVLADAGGLTNLFAAGVDADAGANLVILHGSQGAIDDLVIGTTGTPAFLSGATIASGVTAGGHARLEAADDVTDLGGGGVVNVAGSLSVDAEGDVTLGNILAAAIMEVTALGGTATLGFAGDSGLNLLADTGVLTTTGALTLGGVIVETLDVTLDGTGASLADGALAPSYLTVALSGTDGAAVATAATGTPGAVATSLTGEPLAANAFAALSSVVVTDALSISQSAMGSGSAILDGDANQFADTVAVDVGGAFTLREEVSDLDAATQSFVDSLIDVTAAARADQTDPQELLQFTQLAAGGAITIYSPDQIQFLTTIALNGDLVVLNGTLNAAPADDQAAVLFRGDVGATVAGGASVFVESRGDVFFFGTVGTGSGLASLANFDAFGRNVIAGVRPAAFANDAAATQLSGAGVLGGTADVSGHVEASDLADFIADLEFLGATSPVPPVTSALGEAQYQLEDGLVREDYLVADSITVGADDSVLLLINRDGAGGAFDQARAFFGVNTNSLTVGTGPSGLQTLRFEGYGAVAGDRTRTAGVLINAPISSTYFYNGCRVKQTNECTQLGSVITLPPLPPVDVPIFEITGPDLSELFGAIGNEDLWRLPAVYLSDSVIASAYAGGDAAQEGAECKSGDDECKKENQQ